MQSRYKKHFEGEDTWNPDRNLPNNFNTYFMIRLKF